MAFFWRSTRWLYWGAWLLFGLFMATQDIVNASGMLTWGKLASLLLLNLGQNLAWGLLSLGTLEVARRFPLRDHPPGRHWAAHLLACAVIVPLGTVTSASMAFLIAPPSGRLLEAYLRFASQFISFEFLVCYWGVVGVHEAIQILKQHQQGEIQVSMLESQLAQAELHAIHVQLNPHFLFNTLNTLSALMHSQPAAADRMLVKLSQLLRSSLEQNREEHTSLGQEVSFLEDYLEIERMRFGERLHVKFEVPVPLRDAQIPSFLLQPLVENAIKHGIAARGGVGTLDIRARQEGPDLVLEVQDDGTGTHPQGASTHGTGIGLKNTRLRLEQLFGQEQSFDLHFPAEGGALARIRIPLRLQAASPRFQGSLHPSQTPPQAS
jgi:sensor histidine kinase YesM